jgi:hypothetical protein
MKTQKPLNMKKFYVTVYSHNTVEVLAEDAGRAQELVASLGDNEFKSVWYEVDEITSEEAKTEGTDVNL